MTQMVVDFYGKSHGEYGMPDPFYRYWIVEIPVPHIGPNYYLATITPLSERDILPPEHQYLSPNGMHTAEEMAIDALKNLSQLKSLQMNRSDGKR